MLTTRRTTTLILPLLLLTASAAIRPAFAQPSDTASPGAPTSRQPPSPADRAMMAGMSTMQRNMMDAPLTGDPDQDFVAMMEPHHQGAIAMAQVELRDGRDPELRRMAHDIIRSQSRELAEMRAWQARHPR